MIRAVIPKAAADVAAMMTSATKAYFIRRSFVIGAETEVLLFWDCSFETVF